MKEKKGFLSKLAAGVGILLIIIFGLLLLFNLTIIVKGLINSDVPPSVFGVTPLVVQSGSMSSDVQHRIESASITDLTPEQIKQLKVGDKFYSMEQDYKVENVIVSIADSDTDSPVFVVERPAADHIEVGDLIIVKSADTNDIKVGDIISFMENSSVVTHRVIGINEANGRSFVTKGDANNSPDVGDPVPSEKVVGVFRSRIPALGDFIYFLQKPLGMAIFIGVPVLTFLIYDIIRRSRMSKRKSEKEESLEEELARLREMAKELEAKKAADAEKPND